MTPGDRVCLYCGGTIPTALQRTARYCSAQHRRAAYRLRHETRIVSELLAGVAAGRFSTAAEYAASKRSISRNAKIGTGRGRYDRAVAITDAAIARGHAQMAGRADRQANAA